MINVALKSAWTAYTEGVEVLHNSVLSTGGPYDWPDVLSAMFIFVVFNYLAQFAYAASFFPLISSIWETGEYRGVSVWFVLVGILRALSVYVFFDDYKLWEILLNCGPVAVLVVVVLIAWFKGLFKRKLDAQSEVVCEKREIVFEELSNWKSAGLKFLALALCTVVTLRDNSENWKALFLFLGPLLRPVQYYVQCDHLQKRKSVKGFPFKTAFLLFLDGVFECVGYGALWSRPDQIEALLKWRLLLNHLPSIIICCMIMGCFLSFREPKAPKQDNQEQA